MECVEVIIQWCYPSLRATNKPIVVSYVPSYKAAETLKVQLVRILITCLSSFLGPEFSSSVCGGARRTCGRHEEIHLSISSPSKV